MEQNIQKKFNQAQNEVRLAIMDFIINEKRPFNLETDGFGALKNIRLSSEKDFADITAELRAKDGMVVDEENNVNFIYPVSALPTNHQVKLADGRSFTAMCAIDAIGAAFTFHQDTEIHSVCSVCGAPIHIVMQDGTPVEYSPKDLHALTFTLGEISNWAGSCWNAMNFFCTKNEFDQYAESMALDMKTVIKADLKRAVEEAKATFLV